MKRLTSLIIGLALVAFANTAAVASPPNLTGSWVVDQTGLNGTTTLKVTLTQSGMGLVGTMANGAGMTGTFVNDSQINGKWHGPGGAGWLTIYASPNGHSFNGSWGYNGRKENGTFVGNKVLPPSPVTAKGKWVVAAAGGSNAIVGPMSCTQSGPTALCHIGPIIINGKFRTADKIRATWSGGGKSGWFSFWFNDDNNSFNGVWGFGADTSPVAGRVIGQRSL